MEQKRRLKLLGWVLIATIGAVLVAYVSIHLSLIGSAQPPPRIVVSECRGAASGTRRINSDFGTKFDVSERDFTVHPGMSDMPPGMGYVVRIKNRKVNLVIWRDDITFVELKSAFPIFSEHVEVRAIRTPKGRAVGEDHWGYLKSGERWRYVKFSWGDVVGYRPANPQEAGLLDQVIDSACILVPLNH
jgi:hypothetical protein